MWSKWWGVSRLVAKLADGHARSHLSAIEKQLFDTLADSLKHQTEFLDQGGLELLVVNWPNDYVVRIVRGLCLQPALCPQLLTHHQLVQHLLQFIRENKDPHDAQDLLTHLVDHYPREIAASTALILQNLLQFRSRWNLLQLCGLLSRLPLDLLEQPDQKDAIVKCFESFCGRKLILQLLQVDEDEDAHSVQAALEMLRALCCKLECFFVDSVLLSFDVATQCQCEYQPIVGRVRALASMPSTTRRGSGDATSNNQLQQLAMEVLNKIDEEKPRHLFYELVQSLVNQVQGLVNDEQHDPYCDTDLFGCADPTSLTREQQLDAIQQVYDFMKAQEYAADTVVNPKDWVAFASLVKYWRNTSIEEARYFAAQTACLFVTKGCHFRQDVFSGLIEDFVAMIQENRERCKALRILFEVVKISSATTISPVVYDVFTEIIHCYRSSVVREVEKGNSSPQLFTSVCLLCDFIREYCRATSETAIIIDVVEQGTLVLLCDLLAMESFEIQFHSLRALDQILTHSAVLSNVMGTHEYFGRIVSVYKYAQKSVQESRGDEPSQLVLLWQKLLDQLETCDLPQEAIIDFVMSLLRDIHQNASPANEWFLLCHLTVRRPEIREFVVGNCDLKGMIEIVLDTVKPFATENVEVFSLSSGLLLAMISRAISIDDGPVQHQLGNNEHTVEWLQAILIAGHDYSCTEEMIQSALQVIKSLALQPWIVRLDSFVVAVDQCASLYAQERSIVSVCQEIKQLVLESKQRSSFGSEDDDMVNEITQPRRRYTNETTLTASMCSSIFSTQLSRADSESLFLVLDDLEQTNLETKRRAIKDLRKLNKQSIQFGLESVKQGVLTHLLSFWKNTCEPTDRLVVLRLVNSLANNMRTAVEMAHHEGFLDNLLELAQGVDPMANYWAWSCLRNFSKHPNNEIQRALLDSTILSVLMDVATISWRDCCGILQNMSRHSCDDNRVEIARGGGISFVFQALELGETSAQQAALLALRELMKTKQITAEFNLLEKLEAFAVGSDEMVKPLVEEVIEHAAMVDETPSNPRSSLQQSNDPSNLNKQDTRSPRHRVSYGIPFSPTCTSNGSDRSSSTVSTCRGEPKTEPVSIPLLLEQLEQGDYEAKRRSLRQFRQLSKIPNQHLWFDMLRPEVLAQLFAFWRAAREVEDQLIAVRFVNSLTNRLPTALEITRQDAFLGNLIDLANEVDSCYWAWSCLRNISKHQDSEIQRHLLDSRIVEIARNLAVSSPGPSWRECCGALQNMVRYNKDEQRREIAHKGGIVFVFEALKKGDSTLQIAGLQVLREFMKTRQVVVEFVLPHLSTLSELARDPDPNMSSLGNEVLQIAKTFQPEPPKNEQPLFSCVSSCQVNGRKYAIKNPSDLSLCAGRNTLVQGTDLVFGKTVMIKLYQDGLKSHGLNEVNNLSKLMRHPNSKQFVVEPVDFAEDAKCDGRTCAALVMQCGQSNLKEMVETNAQKGTFDFAVTIMKSIATGLAFLHSQRIVHGDVKLENVVNFGDGTGFPKFKLIDFENSREFNQRMQLDCSPEYCPPELATEILKHQASTKLSEEWSERVSDLTAAGSFDVWCFGVLWIKYLVHGRALVEFQGMNPTAMMRRISEPHFSFDQSLHSLESHVSRPMKELIQQCTQRDPHRRPSFGEILKHPVIGGFNTTLWRASSMHEKLREMQANVEWLVKQSTCMNHRFVESPLPCLWILVPWHSGSAFHPKRMDWTWSTLGDHQDVELRLLCDAVMDDGAVVPCCPCAEDQRIRISASHAREFVERALPVLRCAAVLLQILRVSNLVTACPLLHCVETFDGIDLIQWSHQILSQGCKDDRWMENVVESLQKVEEFGTKRGFPHAIETQKSVSAKLRQEGQEVLSCFQSSFEKQQLMEGLLHQVDASRPWRQLPGIGGLQRISDKTGGIRWVCASHHATLVGNPMSTTNGHHALAA